MRLYKIDYSFTRPNNALAYAAGDQIAATTAANPTPMSFALPAGFLLTNVRLTTDLALGTPQFKVHLFQSSPSSNGDNAAMFPSRSDYLGSVYIDTNIRPFFSDGIVGFGPVDPNLLPIFTDLAAGINGPVNFVYGLLETTSGFNPTANQPFTVSLIGVD